MGTLARLEVKTLKLDHIGFGQVMATLLLPFLSWTDFREEFMHFPWWFWQGGCVWEAVAANIQRVRCRLHQLSCLALCSTPRCFGCFRHSCSRSPSWARLHARLAPWRMWSIEMMPRENPWRWYASQPEAWPEWILGAMIPTLSRLVSWAWHRSRFGPLCHACCCCSDISGPGFPEPCD